jgi:hypothetical protein
MSKIMKLLIAVAATAALAVGAAACASAGNGSLPSGATATGAPGQAGTQAGTQAGSQTSSQAASPGCTVVDATDDVALTASGPDYPTFCKFFTDGEFTSEVGSEISGEGELNGSWVAGGVPAGSVVVCSGTYQTQGSTLPEGDTLTVYDTTGEMPSLSPINSLCDSFIYFSGENND